MDKPVIEFTDLHLCLTKMSGSMSFPGPMLLTEEMMFVADAIVERTASIKKTDFMVTWGGYFFRGHRDVQTVDGEWLRLRKMANIPPSLDRLPTPLPSMVKKMTLAPTLSEGGLVYVIGSPGSGKTTTCSAALVSRLFHYGGYAYTVEDPPEMPLNGWHGSGYCSQTWVSGDTPSDWNEAFRGVLRSQPTNTPCILFVGEVRDQSSAMALLRAASSGFLVFATGFGTDIPSALDTLINLASDGKESKSTLDSLSNTLRLVLHQRLVDGKLSVRSLASVHGRTSVAAKIREGRLNHLEGDIQFQNNQVMMGVDIFANQASGG